MTTTMLLPSDDELRVALLHEPHVGLAAAVADDIARDVRRTPQRRRSLPIAPWARWASEPDLGIRQRRVVWVAATFVLVVALLATLLLVGALLRKPSLLGNGAIALAPSNGGLVLLDAGQQTADQTGPDRATYLTFSPTGDRLALWSGSTANAHGAFDWTLALMDARTRAVSTPITAGVPDAPVPNGPLEWSSDGQRILAPALVDGLPVVLIADLSTGRFERVGSSDMDVSVAAWSPDGTRLAYVAERRFSDDWGLWLAGPGGDDATQLRLDFPTGVGVTGDGSVAGATGVAYPVEWSPDSTKLLITGVSQQGTTTDFVVGVADGSITALTPSTVDPVLSAWSPDGSRIAFLSFDKARNADDLYDIGSDGSNLQHLASNGCGFLAWAPDGSRILFDTGSCDRSPMVAVRSVQADGSDPRVIWSEPAPANLAGANGGRSAVETSATVNGLDSISMSWQGIRP